MLDSAPNLTTKKYRYQSCAGRGLSGETRFKCEFYPTAQVSPSLPATAGTVASIEGLFQA